MPPFGLRQSISTSTVCPEYEMETNPNGCGGSSLVAIGSFDGRVRLLTMYSWQLAFVFPLVHPKDMDAGLLDPTKEFLPLVEVPMAVLGVEETDYYDEAISGPRRNNTGSNRAVDHFGLTSNPITSIKPPQPPIHVKSGRGSHSHLMNPAEPGRRHVGKSIKSLPKSSSSSTGTTSNIGGVNSSTMNTTTTKQRSTPTITNAASVAGTTAGLPSMGVSWMGWSADGELLACREEAYPRCLWVWHPMTTRLEALIVQVLMYNSYFFCDYLFLFLQYSLS